MRGHVPGYSRVHGSTLEPKAIPGKRGLKASRLGFYVLNINAYFNVTWKLRMPHS